MPTLAIIIVSWNTCELLDRAIASAHASLAGSGIGYHMLVVDNASVDGTPAMLRERHPEVELIEAGSNLGFAGGNNLALRQIVGDGRRELGVGGNDPMPNLQLPSSDLAVEENNQTPNSQLPTPDYVLLLNPDTECVGDAIPQLVRYLAAHPAVAVVGPRLVYPDGSVQSSRRRFPSRVIYFCESTPLEVWWPNNPWARRYRYTDVPDDHEQPVDWLVGAALLVRRTAIERAGLLDAGFQMYSEELEWQRRIQGLGVGGWGLGLHRSQATPQLPTPNSQLRSIVYLPAAVIIHHEGKSSEQAPARRYINFQRSRIRDAQLMYGARFAALLRLFLRCAYAADMAIEAGKWLLGHMRPLRVRRMRVYRQVLREL